MRTFSSLLLLPLIAIAAQARSTSAYKRDSLAAAVTKEVALDSVVIVSGKTSPQFERDHFIIIEGPSSYRTKRKYDTYNELLFMVKSDIWMSNPGARMQE